MMNWAQDITRRKLLTASPLSIGSLGLGSLLGSNESFPLIGGTAPKAKRVIYLFMSGGPSHVDTFDPKPLLNKRDGEKMPAEIIKNHEFAMIKESQPLLKGSDWNFNQKGKSGIEVSELFPEVGEVIDNITVIRSVYSDTFNHDPAVMFMNTGSVRFGRPSLGAWLSYGIGSENKDLPAFVVLASGKNRQPLLDSYWGSGFLPAEHQGVQFRTKGDPVLFVKNPDGVSREERRRQVDLINWMNAKRFDVVGDSEINARISQYELAFRMQMSVPELTDLSREPEYIKDSYGSEPNTVSFANNCLLARRLAERGVRFIQLYDKGWDSHGQIVSDHTERCKSVDKPIAALLKDLKQRGMLDDTLVIWGGEFGRTPMSQGSGKGYGRDHHPHGFSMWMAGGGIRGGHVHGATDDFGYFASEDRVHVHDLNATILHCLGIEHERLTFHHQGRDFKLTDEFGKVVENILS
ncbi:MAG: sulfatase [Verrucomicrobiales bacterium]|nr:sulfatase [Verrucomicrobiales bacterium]